MRIKFLLAGVVFLLSAMTVRAVPAKPGIKKTVKLANGTSVEVVLRGDEHFSFYTDDAGQPYVLRELIAEPVSQEFVAETWQARSARSNEARMRRASARRVGKPSSATTGKHRGLVILMQFTDAQFITTEPQATFNRYFNETGYGDEGMTGSVKDFFLSQSYGLLEIDFDVVGPYTTAHDMKYYGEQISADVNDVNPQGMISEAVDAASKDVDFSNYDWDGDGEVDQIFVVYAGYNQAQGADSNTIWPHESRLYDLKKTYNGVTIDTYACSSELRGDGEYDTGHLDGIGTACHEFTHCLGLPDFYDVKYGGNYGTGTWDVMCSGSYNNYSRTPAGYTSYERWFSGWLTPKELTAHEKISGMKPLAASDECYILYNEGNKNEYYLLENRQSVGFDAGLGGHGLLVLHVNYNEKKWASNNVNVGSQGLTIIPADNTADGYSVSGDPYPGKKSNTALTNYTTPASTLNNQNKDGSLLMNKPVTNITESEDGLISFVVCHPGVTPPTVNAPSGETADGFTISWNAVPEATTYEIELTEIPASSKDPKEALAIEVNMAETCYSKTVGFTDISSKLVSYGFPSSWSGSKLYTSPNGLKMGTTSVNGTLESPWYHNSESGELTLVLGSASESATGYVSYTTANLKEGSSTALDMTTKEEQKYNFEFTKAGRMVLNFKSLKDAYGLGIYPDQMMYMDYLAIYEGTFSAKELGIDDPAGTIISAARRATTTTLSTSDTKYTFSGLTTTSTFQYRVRAIGPEAVSGWSEAQSFKFTTGIQALELEDTGVNKNVPVRYFDLQGREVDSQTRGLLLRKQGSKITKIMVK